MIKVFTFCVLSTVKSADTAGHSINDPEFDPDVWPFINDDIAIVNAKITYL